MSARRRGPSYDDLPMDERFGPVRRRGPRVISIRELRWNARLGVVTQLAYLVGKLPRPAKYAAGIMLWAVTLSAVVVVVTLWRWLLAAAVAWLLVRVGLRLARAARQRRRDAADIPF